MNLVTLCQHAVIDRSTELSESDISLHVLFSIF